MMRGLLVTAVLVSCGGMALAGTWDEYTDGGGNAGGEMGAPIGVAQVIPGGGGTLDFITGSIETDLDADLYQIQISDSDAFFASTLSVDGGFAGNAFILTLFDESGMGVVFNPSSYPPEAFGQARLDAIGVPGPGTYYLGISYNNRRPRYDSGYIFEWSSSWLIPGSNNQYTAIDGSGALASYFPLSGNTGDYTIAMGGVSFVPEPGSLALLGLGVAMLFRRR